MSIAVFASGGGSNLAVILARVDDRSLHTRVSLVVSNNSGCGALAIARRNGVVGHHVSSRTHPEAAALADELLRLLDLHSVELIALAGFMKKLPAKVVARYERRIVNIHPGPLPRFGGQGMFGLTPHQAVIDAGLDESEVCVHWVTTEYDQGSVIASRPVPVAADDTAESLQERTRAVEHDFYWRVIGDLLSTRKRVP